MVVYAKQRSGADAKGRQGHRDQETRVPHGRDDNVLKDQVAGPVLISAICDRLADLATSANLHAEYDAAVDWLITCDGGQVAALAKLQHLRRRLFCPQVPADPRAARDLALLDAAIRELAKT